MVVTSIPRAQVCQFESFIEMGPDKMCIPLCLASSNIIMFWRFIHSVVCTLSSFLNYSWLMDVQCFIYPFIVESHLKFLFQFLVTVNRAAADVCV